MQTTLSIRKHVTFVIILLVSILLIGCSSEKIEMPFSYEKWDSMQYTEVKDSLKKLGFTNISLKEEGRHSEDSGEVGTVLGVYFDGEWEFKKGDKFNKETPIVISYLVDNKTKVPISSDDCVGHSCSEIEELFKNAGFTNISAYTTAGESKDNYKDNTVAYVAIGNQFTKYYYTQFSDSDEFCADEQITIYYNQPTTDTSESQQDNEDDSNEIIDPFHKGSDEIKSFNSISDEKITKAMILEEGYTYTEIQLSNMIWIISEVDGNPSYAFKFNKTTDNTTLCKEMANAFYVSISPNKSFEYIEKNLLPSWINGAIGNYTFDSGNNKEWTVELSENDSEKTIKIYIDPWK